MKPLFKTLLLIFGTFIAHTAQAQTDETSAKWPFQSATEGWLFVVLCTVLIVAVLLLVLLAQLTLMLKKMLAPTVKDEYAEAMDKRTFWQKVGGLRPLIYEKNYTLEHDYDGIHELDNPTPAWFMFLFYGTIAFGAIYLLAYHVIGDGNIMAKEYGQEVAMAEEARAVYMKKFANSINEDNAKPLTDALALADGQKIYTQNCVACHGAEGQGGVGPNLADEYWLHGQGDIKGVFHVVSEGVAEKGMISWKKTLNPIQIQQVSSYILTMSGTKPANPKAPQGEKITPATPKTNSTVAML